MKSIYTEVAEFYLTAVLVVCAHYIITIAKSEHRQGVHTWTKDE
jgi:hypothetical protein